MVTQSIKDIEGLGDFSPQNNPNRAISFVDEMISSVERLIEFPESGGMVPENPIFRQIIKNGYRIIYHLRLKKVSIVTILVSGQSAKNLWSLITNSLETKRKMHIKTSVH